MSIPEIQPLVLEVLKESPGKFLKAFEVYEKCLKKSPGILRTSVYTTLGTLLKKGLLVKKSAISRDTITFMYRVKTEEEINSDSEFFTF